MNKILFVVIDGLGDSPIPELKNKTPLESAITPNLDWLAKNGVCGLVAPFWFPWQKYPRSDTAHLALFGYNPKVYYLGRGPYEAAGIGMNLGEGDVVLRANFGTADKNLILKDRRAGRISQTGPLVKSLNGIVINKVKFFLKKSYGHRAGLVLRGSNLSEKISDGDPHLVDVKLKKVVPLDKTLSAQFTADTLNCYLEKARRILKTHSFNKKREKQGKLPANYLLVRGAGKIKKTIFFEEKYGLRAACVAGGGLYKGIAKILGMALLKTKGATGFSDTNLSGKFLTAKKNLEKKGKPYNFLFLHIKAADSLAEDGDFLAKKKFIEKIDKNIHPLLKLRDTMIVITADHSTCCDLKRHCKRPVPVLVWKNGMKPDKVKEFSEKACKNGQLKKIRQLNLMPLILRLSNVD